MQAGLFDQEFTQRDADAAAAAHREAIEHHKHLWQICWNWPGPKVGELAEFHNCIERDVDGNTHYVCMVLVRVLKVDDENATVLVEVDDPSPVETIKALKGIKFRLSYLGIWPPVKPLIFKGVYDPVPESQHEE